MRQEAGEKLAGEEVIGIGAVPREDRPLAQARDPGLGERVHVAGKVGVAFFRAPPLPPAALEKRAVVFLHVLGDLGFRRRRQERRKAVPSKQALRDVFRRSGKRQERVVGDDEGDFEETGALELEGRVLGVEPAIETTRLRHLCSRMLRYSFHGPTASSYWRARTRTIWRMWPRSWTIQAAKSWPRVPAPSAACRPLRSKSAAVRERPRT